MNTFLMHAVYITLQGWQYEIMKTLLTKQYKIRPVLHENLVTSYDAVILN
jgi:hypothetical protein